MSLTGRRFPVPSLLLNCTGRSLSYPHNQQVSGADFHAVCQRCLNNYRRVQAPPLSHVSGRSLESFPLGLEPRLPASNHRDSVLNSDALNDVLLVRKLRLSGTVGVRGYLAHPQGIEPCTARFGAPLACLGTLGCKILATKTPASSSQRA